MSGSSAPDTGNRAFWALVVVSVLARAASAYLACCVLAALVAAFGRWGSGALLAGPRIASVPDLWAAMMLVALSCVGALRSGRALWRGLRGTRLVAGEIRTRLLTPFPAAAAEAARETGLAGRVDVVAASERFALTYGLARPRVAVSSGFVAATSAAELRAVLLHERAHARSRDPLKVLVAHMLTVRHFVLPLLGHLRSAFTEGRELAADRCALSVCGPAALAGALLKAAGTPRWAGSAPAAAMGAGGLLAARIDQLDEGVPPPSRRPETGRVLATVLGALILAWSLAGSFALIAAVPLACMKG